LKKRKTRSCRLCTDNGRSRDSAQQCLGRINRNQCGLWNGEGGLICFPSIRGPDLKKRKTRRCQLCTNNRRSRDAAEQCPGSHNRKLCGLWVG
jgi:hypothetical protein